MFHPHSFIRWESHLGEVVDLQSIAVSLSSSLQIRLSHLTSDTWLQDCVFLKQPGFGATNWHSDLNMVRQQPLTAGSHQPHATAIFAVKLKCTLALAGQNSLEAAQGQTHSDLEMVCNYQTSDSESGPCLRPVLPIRSVMLCEEAPLCCGARQKA